MSEHHSNPDSGRNRSAAKDSAGDAGSAEPAEPDRPPSPEHLPSFSMQVDPDAGLSDDARRFLAKCAPTAAIEALRAVGAPPRRGQDPTDDVRLLIVGDTRMAAMHEQYKNTPGTTDVLTFDARDEDADPLETPLDVDIVICVDEAARQAARRGHDEAHELLLYVVHALLHCLGHDDTDQYASERMHAREDEILAAMGLGAIFAAPEQVAACGSGAQGAAEPTC